MLFPSSLSEAANDAMLSLGRESSKAGVIAKDGNGERQDGSPVNFVCSASDVTIVYISHEANRARMGPCKECHLREIMGTRKGVTGHLNSSL